MSQTVQKEKLWTSSFIVITCVNFLTALVYYLIAVKIVEYTMATYGVSHSVAGTTVTAYVIAAIVARLVFGGKIDQWGLKKAIFIGAVLIAVASGLYIIDFNLGFLYIVRIIHGVGFGIETGSLAAAAALLVPAKRRGEGIGYFSMSQALATGVGPMVGMLLMNAGASFFAIFVLTFAMSLVALAGCFAVKVPQTQDSRVGRGKVSSDGGVPSAKAAWLTDNHVEGKGAASLGALPDREQVAKAEAAGGPVAASAQTPRRLSIGTFLSPKVLPLCSVMLFVMMGYSVVVSFLTMFAEERGLAGAASMYFLVYSAAILLTRPPMGRRLDRKGENSIMYMVLSAVAAGMVVLALSYNGAVLLASAVLLGFGVGAAQSTVQATVPKLAGEGELGKANSTFFVCLDAGYGLGPVLLGAIIPLVGYQVSFLLLAVLALATVGYYHLVHGRKQR